MLWLWHSDCAMFNLCLLVRRMYFCILESNCARFVGGVSVNTCFNTNWRSRITERWLSTARIHNHIFTHNDPTLETKQAIISFNNPIHQRHWEIVWRFHTLCIFCVNYFQNKNETSPKLTCPPYTSLFASKIAKNTDCVKSYFVAMHQSAASSTLLLNTLRRRCECQNALSFNRKISSSRHTQYRVTEVNEKWKPHSSLLLRSSGHLCYTCGALSVITCQALEFGLCQE